MQESSINFVIGILNGGLYRYRTLATLNSTAGVEADFNYYYQKMEVNNDALELVPSD